MSVAFDVVRAEDDEWNSLCNHVGVILQTPWILLTKEPGGLRLCEDIEGETLKEAMWGLLEWAVATMQEEDGALSDDFLKGVRRMFWGDGG